MEVLSIGVSTHINEVKDRLEFEFRFLKDEGLDVNLEIKEIGKITFLKCKINDQQLLDSSFKEKIKVFRHYVANALSDCIINQWEKELLKKNLKNHYFFLRDDEFQSVYINSLKLLNTGSRNGKQDYINQITRKSRILYKILEYLDSSSEIIIEGFIKFRLQEYIESLKEVINKAVEEHLMEKEYREFLRLLKYFVEIQETMIETVHVMIDNSNNFKLLDGNLKVISRDYFGEVIIDIQDGELNFDDLLISALITIAPQRIYLHYGGEKSKSEIYKTIQNVFCDRVAVCKGCDICIASKNIKNKFET